MSLVATYVPNLLFGRQPFLPTSPSTCWIRYRLRGCGYAPRLTVPGGAEDRTRRGILEADLFEAVIGLASNLFLGASIPVAICVLNRNKPPDRRGKVLFVDSAQEGYFRPGKAQNCIDREHIE